MCDAIYLNVDSIHETTIAKFDASIIRFDPIKCHSLWIINGLMAAPNATVDNKRIFSCSENCNFEEDKKKVEILGECGMWIGIKCVLSRCSPQTLFSSYFHCFHQIRNYYSLGYTQKCEKNNAQKLKRARFAILQLLFDLLTNEPMNQRVQHYFTDHEQLTIINSI